MAKTVAILAMPGVMMLDVSGPLDVFAQANVEAGRAFYALRVVGSQPGPIRCSSGARLLTDAVVGKTDEPIDTLLVAGAPDRQALVLAPGVLAWVRGAARRSRRYGSVCTGAFVLGAAGLLDDRHLTTHWAWADSLAAEVPGATIDTDAFHVRDGKLRTAAGVTAGLDLALALVEEDLGREVARRVAGQLVMFVRRPGGQLQFGCVREAGPAGRAALQEVQRRVLAHPELPHSVDSLARQAGLSARHFARLFLAEVGVTPGAWVETARVAAARTLLEEGQEPPKQVAAKCGFSNVDTLRRTFSKHVGVTPAEYRRRHAAPA